MPTPTSRSLEYLRETGYKTAIVEKWNAHAKLKQDLFGFIDLLGMKPGEPLLGIQATSGGNVSARIKKSCNLPELKIWLETGCKFEVWGWSKKGRRGEKKTWKIRKVSITLENLKDYVE